MHAKNKLFILPILLMTFMLSFPLALLAQTRPEIGTPLRVGGTFSQSENTQPSANISWESELENLRDLLRKKQYSYVVSRVNTLVAQGQDVNKFHLFLAQAYEGLGNWDDCIYHASEVIGMSPNDSRGYTIRAGAYYKKSELEKASIDIQKSLKINPNATKAKLIESLIASAQAGAKNPTAGASRPSAPAAAKPISPEMLQNIRWWIVYFIIILAVACVFIYFRYPAANGKASFAKKVDIKEQYDFIRQIGEGGMGKVYEAYDRVLKRRVAIKRVRPELVRSTYVREQFLSEARTVALLRHPNIVEIYTVIESDNSLYLVFEYVDGQTLETRLDIDGFVPFSEAKNIFESICKGLHYAHAQDIIHCDLKPGNIMITESGNAKVMDFGVAKKAVEGDSGARTVAGTPAYMAPEQQKGFMKKQSDVYSLGVCLYEALVGQVPWSVAGFDIANKRIVPPSTIVPYIPREVDDLLDMALREDPNKRIQSIDEFWSALGRIEPLKEQPRPKHI